MWIISLPTELDFVVAVLIASESVFILFTSGSGGAVSKFLLCLFVFNFDAGDATLENLRTGSRLCSSPPALISCQFVDRMLAHVSWASRSWDWAVFLCGYRHT